MTQSILSTHDLDLPDLIDAIEHGADAHHLVASLSAGERAAILRRLDELDGIAAIMRERPYGAGWSL